jgi:hypothetical protein
MYAYELGKPYHPDRKIWPSGNQFNCRGGECELVLFFGRPTFAEVSAVKSGRAEFALYDHDGLVVLCYRFVHPQGGIPWSDAPYQYHLVPEAERIPPPNPSGLSPETRALLHVVLVSATGGQVRALRTIPISPAFTRSLFAAIGRQAARPFDSRQYDSQLKALYLEFLTSDHLADACSVQCEGGD